MDERIHRGGYFGIVLSLVAAGLSVATSADPAGSGEGGSRPIETPHAQALPAVPAGSRVIVTHLYALSLNPQTKLADWCAYTLTPGLFDTSNQLSRNWHNRWPDEALESADYNGSDYQRGHLAPLASFAASPWAHEVNRMEAVIPQRADLNAGPWLTLENRCRALALQCGRVECLAGPAFLEPLPPLPQADEPHQVPSHCWLIVRTRGQASAWLIPQTAGRGDDPDRYQIDPAALAARLPALRLP